MKFYLEGRLKDANEYINDNRSNRYGANAKKQTSEEDLMWQMKAQRVRAVEQPCRIRFTWHDKTKRDLDNIAFSKKFILDAMQKAEILPNDNRTWVKGFVDDFDLEAKKQGVTVEILYV